MSFIVYIYPKKWTFIEKDLVLLSKKHTVVSAGFEVKNKALLPFYFIKQFFFLLHYIFKADRIVCHFAGFSSLLPAIFAKLTFKKYYVIVAGTDGCSFPDFNYGHFSRYFLAKATCISLRLSTKIFPVHPTLKYQAYQYHEPGAPVQGYGHFCPKSNKVESYYIPYGFDSDAFVTYDLERPINSFITVGSVGDDRVIQRKGFDLIIEAAARKPELNFTLIGWNMPKTNLPSNIRVLPFSDQTTLVKELNNHQFYLQLSIMEGFPNALGEAMLCGCIPIGSSVSAIPEMIGKNGFVLEKKNTDDLIAILNKSQAIATEHIKIMENAARQSIIDRYSNEFREAELLNAMELKN